MTSFLLDTHVFVWLKVTPERLRRETRDRLADPDARVLFSVVSAIELFDKLGKGRNTGIDQILREGENLLAATLAESAIELLPVTLAHTAMTAELALHHRDPFDRLLIAQAISDRLTLVSGDGAFERYASLNLLKT